MSPKSKYWLRTCILVAVGLFLAFDIAVVGSPLFFRARIVAGRHRTCSISDMTWMPDRASDVRESERLVALSRVIRTDGDLQLVETPRGAYWASKGAMQSLCFVLAELRDKPYFNGSCRVRPGDIVLDCGANFGIFTRQALAAGARLVVAIEPAPGSAAALRRTFAEEVRANRVIVCERGVWDKADFLDLAIRDDSPSGDSLVLHWFKPDRLVRVPLTTIDQLTADLKLERVDFVKMDIEGAEPQALSGARETIRKYRPRMAISLEHRGSDVDRLPELVHGIEPALPARCGPCVWVRSPILNRLQPQNAYFGG